MSTRLGDIIGVHIGTQTLLVELASLIVRSLRLSYSIRICLRGAKVLFQKWRIYTVWRHTTVLYGGDGPHIIDIRRHAEGYMRTFRHATNAPACTLTP